MMHTDWSKPFYHVPPEYRHRPDRNEYALVLSFREIAEPNGLVQKRTGRVAYDRITQVRVQSPVNKQSFPIHEVERWFPDEYMDIAENKGHLVGNVRQDRAVLERYGDEYSHWRKGTQPAESGTPLEVWPLINDAATARMFKDHHIHTVEQLAGLSDAAHEAVKGPTRDWQKKAKIWLAERAGSVDVAKLAEDNARMQSELEQMREQMARLVAGDNASPGFDKPKRGKGGSEPRVVIPEEAPERL